MFDNLLRVEEMTRERYADLLRAADQSRRERLVQLSPTWTRRWLARLGTALITLGTRWQIPDAAAPAHKLKTV
jgi:hypothetical protein